jgi:eukaryotic-like serine/threonine-protein kinase
MPCFPAPMYGRQVSNFTPQSAGGERFGRYVLLELIGRGGMAEVYRSVAHGLEGFQRVFVIKRILKEKCATPEFVEMFVNEARLSALLNHPNIVQIYDFGQISGSYFLAMEHLRGKDLLSVLRQLRVNGTKMAPEVAAYIAQQVAHGLDYAHTLTHAGKNLRIVHRDVSPSNIMLLRAGGVKLLDFGIAKAAMEIRSEAETTQAGLVKGKLSYVSPEQIRGAQDIDGRSDVFALGVVLWECLTGRRLFFDRNDFQTMRNVLERPVPPPSTQRAEVPAALDFVVLRALEREPKRRYPDAKTMADELEAVLQEARFAPRAMTRMLDELFGAASSQVDLHVPEPAVVAGAGSVGNGVPVPIAEPVTAVPGNAPAFSESGPNSYTGVSSVRRLPARGSRRGSWLAAGVAVVLAVASGSVLVSSSRRRAVLSGASEESFAAEARATEAPGGSGEPQNPADTAVVAIESAPVKVSVRIDSDPRGAQINSDTGKLLGVTPTTLAVVRSDRPLFFEVTRTGFLPSQHSVVPDRDVSALLTLHADDEAARKRSAHRRRGGAAPHEGRVREGLSVDPFADDHGKPRR